MTWPRQIYVATATLGVYYTGDFSDPATQPTWTAINTGLAATDCREFHVDPFAPGDRQYVLLEASRTLYRRDSGGAWASILTSAQVAAIVGQAASIRSFCTDAATAGRMYVSVQASAFWEPVWSIRSDDYGTTWSVTGTIRAGWYTYAGYWIRAYGNHAYATAGAGGGAPFVLYHSSNYGVNWSSIFGGGLDAGKPICLNPLLPDRVYSNPYYVDDTLYSITSGGAASALQAGLGPDRLDSMWFDPSDANHQRIVEDSKVYSTADAWATVNVPSAISPAPISIASYAGNDTDQMLIGLTLGDHIIGALYGEADTTAAGIAGTNAATSPYAGSIPKTCGGLASNGIIAVPLSAHVYTYDVLFEAAAATGGVHTGSVMIEAPGGGGGVHTGTVAMEE